MTTISEAGFETVNNWIYISVGSYKSGGQSTFYASEGSNSYRLTMEGASGNSKRHDSGDYAGVKQTINFNSDFTLRFDYRNCRCGGGNGDGFSGRKIRVMVDNTVIEDISLGDTDTTVTNHDTVISGYSGNHDLKILFYQSTSWTYTLYDQCIYVDNLRVVSETLHTNYYVKPTGSNANTGISWEQAWRNPGYGLQNCPNGATLHIASNSGDEYPETPPISTGLNKIISVVVENEGTTTRGSCKIKMSSP